MERYKSFMFLLLPLALIMLGLEGGSKLIAAAEHTSGIVILITVVAIFVVAIMASLHFWVRCFYGRYARQIRKILDELRDE